MQTDAINEQNGYHDLPDDIEGLRALYIREGGNPNTKPFQGGEYRAKQKALAEYADIQRQQLAGRSALQRLVGEVILRGMEVIAVLFTLVLILGGLTVGTVLLVIAEISAVENGFTAIDPDRAGLYAIATVAFFIVVLFIREVIARDAGETTELKQLFSLRYLVQRAIYFVGWRNDWQPEYRAHRTLLNRADSAVTWLMWTIILFGLLGRLLSEISGLEMAWYEALRHIIEQSTLRQLVGYIASIPAMVGLLLATHFVVYLIHQIYVRVTGGLEVTNFFDGYSADLMVENEVKIYYQTEILKLRAKNEPQLNGGTQN